MVGRELSPSDHSKKDIRKILEKLASKGWTIHAAAHWGTLYCPCANKCTTIPVGSSPENVTQDVKRIQRMASKCPKPADSPQRSLTGMDRSR